MLQRRMRVRALAGLIAGAAVVCGVCSPLPAGAEGGDDVLEPAPTDPGNVEPDSKTAEATFEPPARKPLREKRPPLGIQIEDRKILLTLHPIAALDYQVFIDSDQRGPSNRFQIPLAALVMNGTMGKVGLNIFAGYVRGNPVLLDAWGEVRLSRMLSIRAGKQRIPFTDERLSNPPFLPFFAPSAASSLLPTRDLGVRATGRVARIASYDLGIFAGNAANTIGESEVDGGKDALARVQVTPFARAGLPAIEKLSLGVAGSYGRRNGTAENPGLPVFRAPSGAPFFVYGPTALASGRIIRLVPQMRWEAGSHGLYADYVHARHQVSGRDVTSRAWHVVGRTIVTGEKVPFFRPIAPARDVEGGGVGAIELVATLGRLDLDEDLFPDLATPGMSLPGTWVYGGGVSWYAQTALRIMANLQRTDFDDFGMASRSSENLLTFRVQVVL